VNSLLSFIMFRNDRFISTALLHFSPVIMCVINSQIAVQHSEPETTPLLFAKALVLNSVSSPLTRAMYGKALDDFFAWWEGQGRRPLSRWLLQEHRVWLEEHSYSPSTINQRLAALRKLVREAAANGFLPLDTAVSMASIPGVKMTGTRLGNWLTAAEVRTLLQSPDRGTLKGARDFALLAVLLGCGLRRAEAAGLTLDTMQRRDGRWTIPDLRGKHGRIRTIPVPAWVKAALDIWVNRAGLNSGPIFRRVDRHENISTGAISPNAVFDLVSAYGARHGWSLAPHDLRRTFAKLCRSAGGDLEQIQLVLGHASVQTTQRYLGTGQNLTLAPNDLWEP